MRYFVLYWSPSAQKWYIEGLPVPLGINEAHARMQHNTVYYYHYQYCVIEETTKYSHLPPPPNR